MEKGARIEIKITSKDDGNVTKLVKDYNFYPDLGWECGFQAAFAESVCQMMDLLGYHGYKKDYIFLEGINLEEYDYLVEYLDELREKKEEGNEE